MLGEHCVGDIEGEVDGVAADGWGVFLAPEEEGEHGGAEADDGGAAAEDVAGAVVLADSLSLLGDDPAFEGGIDEVEFEDVRGLRGIALDGQFVEAGEVDVDEGLLLCVEVAPDGHPFAELVGEGDKEDARDETVLDVGVEASHGTGGAGEEGVIEETDVAGERVVGGVVLAVEVVVEGHAEGVGEG